MYRKVLGLKWYHYDSLNGTNYRAASRLASKMNTFLNGDTLPTWVEAKCTQQDNSYDCGAFVMVNAQRAAQMAMKCLYLGNCIVEKKGCYTYAKYNAQLIECRKIKAECDR